MLIDAAEIAAKESAAYVRCAVHLQNMTKELKSDKSVLHTQRA